ncbi:hypothetical protein [Gelidibacter pelagius]|uniref:Nucleotidyltransferase AbiEii toxin of type IV toxin-antitoxin system n=1 Tax=Gelidibacter pelagius TaxID=2819985 RepID=A0ABS3SQ64_9FLAO|nr:hypothetical protein [Gelidibacter pelagius]MBO3097839.1 hypothetical protein [Gelidibacter pelagius]
MRNNTFINLKVVAEVAHALGDLNAEVVYIGGAIISIYATDAAAEPPRVTTDVDVCVQVSSLGQMEALRERLQQKNIYPDPEGTHLYRYTYQGILIDFIPYEATPLGPTNPWLKPGFAKAFQTRIDDVEISVLPVSLFLATKWEAFKSRGTDPRWSHDFEDIIYVLDTNLELIEEVSTTSSEVKNVLKLMSLFILEHPNSQEIIECHINQMTAHERAAIIKETLQSITQL